MARRAPFRISKRLGRLSRRCSRTRVPAASRSAWRRNRSNDSTQLAEPFQQAVDVLFARPVTARDPDQISARKLPNNHVTLTQLRHELGGIALRTKGDEARLLRLRDDLEALGEGGPAKRSHLGNPVEAPLRCHVERG